MGTFVYKAVSNQGKYKEGRLEAADSRAAAFSLQNMRLIPVSIEQPAPRRSLSLGKLQLRRVTRKDILFFTEELSTLIRAGLPLDRSLSITAELASSAALESIIKDVLQRVKGGRSLVSVAHDLSGGCSK